MEGQGGFVREERRGEERIGEGKRGEEKKVEEKKVCSQVLSSGVVSIREFDGVYSEDSLLSALVYPRPWNGFFVVDHRLGLHGDEGDELGTGGFPEHWLGDGDGGA